MKITIGRVQWKAILNLGEGTPPGEFHQENCEDRFKKKTKTVKKTHKPDTVWLTFSGLNGYDEFSNQAKNNLL